jgi:3-hydroxybutyryl-CoA dehydrogenase
MKIEDVKKVCVAGTGQMGRQIALNCALYGYETYLMSRSQESLSKVETWSNGYLAERVEKAKLTREAADSAKAKFHFTTSMEEAAKDVHLLIESVVEEKDAKSKFFKDFNAHAGKDVIFASNSSYMPSSMFKDCVDNPARLVTFHYFNPALAMQLVEVIKGEHTSEDTVSLCMEFARATGKTPIRVNKEIDGFVVNRVLRAIRDEAFYLIEQGICTPQDLDTGVELGLKHPMGPFRLLDLTGVDLNYMTGKRRLEETGVKPNGFDIIKEMYEKKEWGRKTGKGFYTYEK